MEKIFSNYFFNQPAVLTVEQKIHWGTRRARQKTTQYNPCYDPIKKPNLKTT